MIQALPSLIADQEMSAQDKKMMDQMMKYGTPGKGHEFLKKYVGDWDVDISTWPTPGAPAQMSKGTMKNQLIFDGRYVKCDFEGTMGGMSLQGSRGHRLRSVQEDVHDVLDRQHEHRPS